MRQQKKSVANKKLPKEAGDQGQTKGVQRYQTFLTWPTWMHTHTLTYVARLGSCWVCVSAGCRYHRPPFWALSPTIFPSVAAAAFKSNAKWHLGTPPNTWKRTGRDQGTSSGTEARNTLSEMLSSIKVASINKIYGKITELNNEKDLKCKRNRFRSVLNQNILIPTSSL